LSLTPLVMVDCRIYLASADLTGFSNKQEWSSDIEDLDKTTFASGGAKERTGGLFDTTANVDCFWQAGDKSMPDDAFWDNLGVATVPYTVVPTLGTVGSLAYLTRMLECSIKPLSGDVGKLLKASGELKGNWPPIRGTVLHPQGTARSTTGTGTAQQLGALSATQSLYVNLHALSVSGTTPSLTVKIQSDDNSGFTSATDRGTFNAETALGRGQTMKIDGAVTDDWWRVAFTISGTTPSFLFACAAGIGPK
jgi:hypothetical protein